MNSADILKIAAINDTFRQSGVGVVISRGVQALSELNELLRAVREYDQFSHDPEEDGEEHDFGALQWCGQRVFWKIDYYDSDLSYGEDPLSPKCRRVLTIMLTSEY